MDIIGILTLEPNLLINEIDHLCRLSRLYLQRRIKEVKGNGHQE